ncbi:MAG TPA: hypothetical protein DFR83_06955 [Deltaproteobacteria bacterium]|nr:hypothetical protein [Deltaproteobacteria bacterium]
MILAPLLLTLACKKAAPPAPPVSPDAPPILPSPTGSNYALGERTPADPIVYTVVERSLLPWSESLSGAATAVALDHDHEPSLPAAQWAAIRAGYPHSVVAIISGTEPPGTDPVELIDALSPNIRIGDHLGLVRARTAMGDRWVALVGRPKIALDPFPRELKVGATLEVTGSSINQWVMVSPSGKTQTGAMPLSAQLHEPGEWWLEFQTADASHTPLQGVPIYVGMPTPKVPLIPVLDVGVLPGPNELQNRALDALYDVRNAFNLVDFEWDDTLASLAVTPVQQVLGGTWDAERGVQRLRGAGFIGGPAAQLTCTSISVEACITDLAYRADSRATLLHPGLRLVGVAGEVRTSGVTLVLNFSSE